MSFKNNKSFLLLLLVLVATLAYGIYSSINSSNAIEKESVMSKCVITSKYSVISRGYYVNYEFYVNGNKYEGTQKLKKKDLDIVEGDEFVVEYAKSNPSYNKIYLDKKITDE
ncbi:hypothetical protein L0P88_10110 [Muricauda sp. SCSIO 64092]|uniref:hypothetical protein n=1 Tax=Allomuricauda sp. SCSIO 64092 TaxID=2908842 RepID=UPI001FF5BF69|nr:hypothetical protein [Muricauda sp. SCSIO 64092]UOY08887.1 hypothetical protein L0P88_10110 [Muricauda sp. SCSIO 64092]